MKNEERETAFNHPYEDTDMYMTTSEPKIINKVRRLQLIYPDQVHIEQDYGDQINCSLPFSWFKIKPKSTISNQRKEEASERFKKMWAERKENKE